VVIDFALFFFNASSNSAIFSALVVATLPPSKNCQLLILTLTLFGHEAPVFHKFVLSLNFFCDVGSPVCVLSDNRNVLD
jgi:hypothetical protein